MANSLETRAPLLDHRLWEYVAALPTSYKFVNGETKHLLRALLRGQVPPAVLTRPKQGFAIPRARWFRANWLDTVRPLLLGGDMSQYFARPCVERMLEEHASGRIDHGEHLWLLLVFAVWHEHYLRGRPARPAHPVHLPRGEQALGATRVNGYAHKRPAV